MDNRGSFFFLLIVFYLLLSSQSRPPLVDQSREHQREVDGERNALRRLNESKYGDLNPQAGRWLPFAGVRENDSYAWDLLPQAQDMARHQIQSVISNSGLEPSTNLAPNLTQMLLPVYRNVTGKLRGDWVRHKQDRAPPQLNMTAIALENEYFTHEFSSNVTGNSGTFYLDLREGGGEELRLGDGQIREIRASLAVESDDFWGNTWYLSLVGLHFPETGGIILSTTSEKFEGLFSLPHFALSQDSYELAHQLLIKSLSDTMSEKSHQPTLFPWSSIIGTEQVEFPAPKCEHIVYLQQHPVAINDYLADPPVIEEIEKELRYPIGAPIPPPPPTVMSAVVFSPDCGYILETKSTPDYPPSETLYLSGPKLEELAKYSARLVLMVCCIFVTQITLLLRQIKEASTPSTRSRVSFYTIAIMAFGDAFVLVFILLELYPAVSFLLMSTVSFLTFLSVSYIGMKFMMEIWAVQEPERQDRRPSPPISIARPTTLPLPATAARPGDTGAPPVILTPDQDPPDDENETPANQATAPAVRDPRGDVGAMYARFYFILFVMLIVTIWSFIWPNRLKTLYARCLGFIYLSFWSPQIYRNVIRNCRKALRWDFMVGQSIVRLFPFVYLLTVRGNVLFIRPDSTTAFVMAAWVWIQVWILASQDILGPRFFVPRGWAPPAYDYHPILRENAGTDEDLESGGMLPIGALRADERDVASESKEQDKHRPKDKKKAVFDCAICMQEMEVPILAALGAAGGSSVADGASSILSRRTYMVTPCRHIFHSTCLESWMRLRLQCPICRESIPPV
ncbi:hypothetical protein ASPWEDRAFT_133237 [Aspergillus wentii DTO 134E9]|uniref:DSC E3 ubiquitin ligase complex subunit A n=1 Tax=Aspergillus wentii DTO 134E9 TaxID=1073089 RepID=A0A1L9RK04_ASPWE|nr:uncharacterized protein ASPWEDRAFT_133237 [Aspergillus wentii DTO 134E9]KAI9923594.1 hypothetical protein MW887_008516 [Aspergillus wentii]OJJ35269.1 hypothetical protein ASPWEDRAFT_133237 [Aspergillus wentii DTO 134E9]